MVPGPIDRVRFDDALERTLSVYPLFAGRMVRPKRGEEGPWRVSYGAFIPELLA